MKGNARLSDLMIQETVHHFCNLMIHPAVLVMVCNEITTITELRGNKLETNTLLFIRSFVQVSIVEIMYSKSAPRK